MSKSIVEWSKEYKHLVDKEILKFIPNIPYPPNLYAPIWYHLKSGGKRLRSTCAILIYKSLGGDIKKIMPFAAACEILHHWLLIHDDIEDEDVMRREKPTVWAKYGLNTGINVGDFLSEKVYEIVLSLREKNVSDKVVMNILELTIDTALKTGLGQALDMYFKNTIPTESEYLKMIKLKTGAYLALPMLGAAIIAGTDKETIQLIKQYGEYIGPAYQIIDDILDYNEMSKNFGSDIKEGKRTLIMIHCISKCKKNERLQLIKILNKKREKTTKSDIKYVITLLEKYKSIDYSFNKAKLLVEKGKRAIDEVKNIATKTYLNEIADFIINRNF